ncbi:MAG: FliH/SctL family protein [Chromatiales bacterium]|nr:FliH/SctL family protein [Chromatiales bacterium]
MDTLIRAARLGKQPVLLRREDDASPADVSAGEPAAGYNGRQAVLPEARVHPAPVADANPGRVTGVDRGAANGRGEPAVSELAAAPVTGADTEPRTISYEEYEQRLGGELERMRQSAREDGYTRGQEQARAQVQAEYAGELEHLRDLLKSVRAAAEQQVEGLMDVGAEIVYEAVTRIIGRVLLDPQGITAVVREVIRHAKDRSRLVVRVHPDDRPVLAACAEELVAGLNVGQIEVLGDDRVVLGGCLLETPAGNLDGRLEIQLQQLQDALLAVRARHADPAGES